MAAITTQTMKAPFDVVSAGGITFTFTAGNTGGDTITITGRELIIVYNSHASTTYTFTVASVVDGQNRTGDLTSYSLATGEFAYLTFGLTNQPGWKNSSTGLMTITPNNAAIKYAVLKLPAGYPG